MNLQPFATPASPSAFADSRAIAHDRPIATVSRRHSSYPNSTNPAPMNALELKIPPLVVLALVAGLMWFGARVAPAADFPLPARRAIAIGLAAVGAGIAVAGVVAFRRAKTTVNPLNPEAASALVVSGVYRLTRNPMYLGSLVVLLGWAAFLANALALIFAGAFVLYLNRFQIAPEEKALASRFGPAFAGYCATVRRWL